MVLTVHHLQASQSERIPWLCEEMQIPYNLILHQRAPIFSPQSIKDLNPLGQAPIIQDGSLTLAESAACAEYIIHVHGHGALALTPTHKNYPSYLYWFHFANGNLQPQLLLLVQLGHISPNPSTIERYVQRLDASLALMNAHLLATGAWLAGEDFTAADIMTVFTLTTMRMFHPLDLSRYPGILSYLDRVAQREGYRKARAKADPELELMIEGKPPRPFRDRLEAEGRI
ncbi:MAG: hypothetical protein LQ351_004559 [Letrouitia transgressa]|nr:MAG: hypothetical protein LQ351_004559 [Letrouitia transgressa]